MISYVKILHVINHASKFAFVVDGGSNLCK